VPPLSDQIVAQAHGRGKDFRHRVVWSDRTQERLRPRVSPYQAVQPPSTVTIEPVT
jgi:hypothetical protein